MNKGITIFIVLTIMCTMSVSAASYHDQIKDQALLLNGTTQLETATNIHLYTLENLEYKFYNSPRNIASTWRTMRGDCTDRSLLSQKMLSYYGIDSRIVHGYSDEKYRHDWLEFNIDGEWMTFEEELFYSLEKVGMGAW